MNPVKIQSSQGNIAAVIHPAINHSGKLAILCPGYLDSKDYTHLVMLAQDLSVLGYDVIRFDPTGTWESDGDISQYTNTNYLENIRNVLAYMQTQSQHQHVLLAGHSRGGQMAILYAARDERISQVVAIMPSSSLTWSKELDARWKADGFRKSSRDIPGESTLKDYSVPYSHNLDRIQYDSLTDVNKIHVPIVLLTGELDKTVLPEHVKALYDRANEPKKYIALQKIGHDYRKNVDSVKIVNKQIIQAIS